MYVYIYMYICINIYTYIFIYICTYNVCRKKTEDPIPEPPGVHLGMLMWKAPAVPCALALACLCVFMRVCMILLTLIHYHCKTGIHSIVVVRRMMTSRVSGTGGDIS